jgi:hypothetical protein
MIQIIKNLFIEDQFAENIKCVKQKIKCIETHFIKVAAIHCNKIMHTQ